MAVKKVFDDPAVGERVRHAYVDMGHDMRRIAADCGMSLRTLVKCMRHFEIQSRPAGRPRGLRDRARMMRTMHDGGVSIAEIGRRFEVTPRTVYGSLHRYGHWEPRDRDGWHLLRVFLAHEGVLRDAKTAAEAAAE